MLRLGRSVCEHSLSLRRTPERRLRTGAFRINAGRATRVGRESLRLSKVTVWLILLVARHSRVVGGSGWVAMENDTDEAVYRSAISVTGIIVCALYISYSLSLVHGCTSTTPKEGVSQW